eukprot:1189610-Prorocentrum_minimum.AAC.1
MQPVDAGLVVLIKSVMRKLFQMMVATQVSLQIGQGVNPSDVRIHFDTTIVKPTLLDGFAQALSRVKVEDALHFFSDQTTRICQVPGPGEKNVEPEPPATAMDSLGAEDSEQLDVDAGEIARRITRALATGAAEYQEEEDQQEEDAVVCAV